MTTYRLLLWLHIASGHVALAAAVGAMLTRKGSRWHVYTGRLFTLGMALVFVTAVPMTLIKPNLFLLLIAIFSFYLALTGWLRARNRTGARLPGERFTAAVMAVTAAGMLARGVLMLAGGRSMGTVLLVFGGIGGALAALDLRQAPERYRGAARIAGHLSRMLAGTVATVTAFSVVNIRLEPAVIVWLAPTVVFTPLIVYWNVRIRRPHARSVVASVAQPTPR
ncbi:MAG TPA: hypothetical protein VGM22_07490 [Methylomirabilota bacterium]|jgi:hypothetical protein